MSNNSFLVVCKEVELLEATSLSEGKFNPHGPHKVLNDRKIVQRSYVERMNAETTTGKKFYIIDEEATAAMESERQKKQLERIEKEKLSNVSTADVLSALMKEKKPKTELEQLREKCDELGIEYSNRMGVKTLKSKIEKVEENED